MSKGMSVHFHFNVEAAQAQSEDVESAMRTIVGEMVTRARDFLDEPFPVQMMQTALTDYGALALSEILTQWAKVSDKPLVLFIDEIDVLIDDTLISVLRQLRAGYDKRPTAFPQTIILCGVRDVRDYRIHSSQEKTIVTGGSAFN